MKMTDARLYLKGKGIPDTAAYTCSMPQCSNVFLAREGFAFEGVNTNTGECSIYLFCSDVCYLTHIPPKCCGRA